MQWHLSWVVWGVIFVPNIFWTENGTCTNAIAPVSVDVLATTDDSDAFWLSEPPQWQRLPADFQAQNSPAPPVNPQPDPNRDRFLPLPSAPESVPSPAPDSPLIPPPATPETPGAESDQQVLIQRVEVTGSTIFTAEDLAPITQTVEGKLVTLEQLRQVADAISQRYLEQGYITSRAVLVDQEIVDGVVQIYVVEGSLAQINIEGTRRVNPSYIRSRIELGAGVPLNTTNLENQLRLLRLDPLFENIEASLSQGQELGKSILTVRVTENDPFDAYFSIDNYSPPSVGSERFGITLRDRNLTGLGDEFLASYYFANGSSNLYDFSYRLPINAMNGTLQFRAAPSDNRIVQDPFDVLEISGESELYEVSYRQPLVRSPRQEIALSVGFTYQNGQTFTFQGPTPFGIGPDEDGISRTSTLKFAQDFLSRDVGGAWLARSQFSVGTGLFDATTNTDPTPDGRFFSWSGQLQRVQRLGDNHLLIIQTDLQLTPDSLLPAQQFVIGGGQSLRGYRQNARSGDNGFRFSIEDRITLERNDAERPIFQLAPFIDVGAVWNVEGNPNPLPSQTFLTAIGVGVLWEIIPGLNLRLDYALPLVELDDKGNNAQDEGFYFSVNYGL